MSGLSLVATTVSGYLLVHSGYHSIRSQNFGIDLAMETAIITAIRISYFVNAATLTILFRIAALLRDYTMFRAHRTRDQGVCNTTFGVKGQNVEAR